VREHAQFLIIGAGAAGLGAALEAARHGIQAVVVDEHPVEDGLVGLDIPFHFGSRMAGRSAAALERLVESDPRVAEAFEAGVDLRFGVSVWGLFSPRQGQRWLRERLAGLSDGESAWFLSFDAAIIATGRRDFGISFPGWEQPGVMGVTAADAALRRYDAFSGQRIAVLGSGVEATSFAQAALAAGREVAALIEAAEAPLDAQGCSRLAAQGVPVLMGSMIGRALGGVDGVERIRCVKLGTDAAPVEFACDTVVLAAGAVPVIDLLDVAGAAIVFDAARGGHVPVVDADGRTSVPLLFAAGDCAGITPKKTLDAASAAAEGARAAAAAVAAKLESWPALPNPQPARTGGMLANRLRWAQAAMAVADEHTSVCQCEEVSLAALLGVQPPRYLHHDQLAMRARDLAGLAADGALNQDQVKRLTRAGMGACQGRRCREQIGALLSCATGTPLADIPLPSYRAPVRPLPLAVFAATEEDPALADNWFSWFGIDGQWTPFWELAEPEPRR
jgi:thioredoxin reductase